MSRSSGRAQVEPTAALAAVLALTVALGLYAAVHASVPLGGSEAHPATAAREHVAAALGDETAVPASLPAAAADAANATPTSSLNATLRTASGVWTVGPPRPPRADVSTQVLPVDTGNGVVRPGRLTVAVWR